jgi:hypothetical protein
MSADILAKFYGLIFFSAIFIVAAVRRPRRDLAQESDKSCRPTGEP